MHNLKEDVDVQEMYGKDSKLLKDKFLEKYKVKETGLSNKQAEENIRNLGLNEIKQAKPKKWYHYFLESLLTPFNLILIGISIILVYTDIYLAEVPSYANIIVIAILVIASTLLDFFESYKSNKAAEKLKEMVATTAVVIRNGKEVEVPVKNVTRGDIILLSAGSMIPADLRIIEAKDLYVGQSSLTGESDSVKKTVELENSDEEVDSIADLNNICFMGTNVISGSAKGVVIKTGDSTYFGKIAHTISSGKEKTAFQKGIENISKLLIRFMLIMIPLVFIINVQKHDIVLAFTFAVAIAICITPLLLPVILSSSLSKGAVRMSKKKTIVKKLDSIQNFGAMNILCTDKTGTLTEDRIVLEKYLDIKGEEDTRVLKHAFLNAYFQTGLKGSIDEAVIKRAEENNISDISKKYKKIDEIPFDFSRRRLSVVVSDGTKKQLITKGAVEEILNICTMIDYKGEVSPITKEIKSNIEKIAKELNEEGLRVVAVCQKNDIENIKKFDVADEKNMVLMGFIGFLDPPKETAKESIEKLNNAGIRVIVLTGDNAEVTRCVCNKVGINSKNIVLGSKIDKLSDMALLRLTKKTNIFAKLSPIQKARIVRILKQAGNIVGYMGDGINDSPSLTNSDVGVSVDTAVDIAKESADIILLEKDLNVLLDGVTEGRRTFVNLMKYIKMATSFNFGEVVSVIIASACLPFLPETPIQLLVEGLLYDFGQMTIPFDNVDKELLEKPKKLDIKSLKRFMLFMGPVSSLFDLVVFTSLWFVFMVRDVTHFQTVWFTYSIVSNLIGMHIIRTAKLPFVQSNAHKAVYISSTLLILVGIAVPFTALGAAIGLAPLALRDIGLIFGVTFLYCIIASIAKKIYIKKYKEWI
ncbi:MAG TPA: magnesium-translocating P-type ATPase [Candidatus Scatovivens faecipullorum]|nr:magnesium-translocating P-type ATPase [Candidatus Scatovivens faecipullorum]